MNIRPIRMLAAACAGLLLLASTGCSNAERDDVEHRALGPDTLDAIVEEPVADVELIDRTDAVMQALQHERWDQLANYVHPQRGVQLSAFSFDNPTEAVVLTRDEVRRLQADSTAFEERFSATDAGMGEPVWLSMQDYFRRFVYDKDTIVGRRSARERAFDGAPALEDTAAAPLEDLGMGEASASDDVTYVEFFAPNSEQEEGVEDDRLRLVFERGQDTWFLVGIVYNHRAV